MEEEVKTIQEVSKLATKALETGDKLGGFLSRVFGAVPEDVVGLVGGDFLHHIRIRNGAKLQKGTDEILKERGLENDTQPLSPNIALPLLNAALDESREELQELWARMLANAMDPNRSKVVRRSIIETVRAFEPIDAKVLEIADAVNNPQPQIIAKEVNKILKAPMLEFEVSLKNLEGHDCIAVTLWGNSKAKGVTETESFVITHFGNEILRACSL